MGALPSQKYDMVCIAFLKYFFRAKCDYIDDAPDDTKIYAFEELDIDDFVREFLCKCDSREIEI